MRSAASGSLIVALNETELNGDGRLQLSHTQKEESLAVELTLDSRAAVFRSGIRNLMWFGALQLNLASSRTRRHERWRKRESEIGGRHLHFFSVNWWSKHDFPTPMSPVERDREAWRERGGQLRKAQKKNKQFSVQARSVAPRVMWQALRGRRRQYLTFHVE